VPATGLGSNGEHRRQLLEMAETWEGLAYDREEQIARQRRIAEMESGCLHMTWFEGSVIWIGWKSALSETWSVGSRSAMGGSSIVFVMWRRIRYRQKAGGRLGACAASCSNNRADCDQPNVLGRPRGQPCVLCRALNARIASTILLPGGWHPATASPETAFWGMLCSLSPRPGAG